MTLDDLTSEDLDKLANFSKDLAIIHFDKVPKQLNIQIDEFQSIIYETFPTILNSYKDGSRSFTSYFYEYAWMIALDKLTREYRRLKTELNFDDCAFDDNGNLIINKKLIDDSQNLDCDEDGHVCHKYGIYDFEQRTTLQKHIEQRDLINQIRNRCDDKSKLIIDLFLKDYTQQQIADEIGISQKSVSKRIEKLGDIAKTLYKQYK